MSFIHKLGDPVLKSSATPVDRFDDSLRRQVRRMAGIMSDAIGVGLAAPQLDELVRIVAVDVSGHPKAETSNGLLVLVDPAVVGQSGSEVAREGCLSIPHLTANVRRATAIELRARTPAGDPVELASEGFEARCLLHEIDHLDGLLFLDRVDSLATDVFRRKRRG